MGAVHPKSFSAECNWDLALLPDPLEPLSLHRIIVRWPDGTEWKCLATCAETSRPTEVPATRWQGFKARWFPGWLKRWFPVKTMIQETMTFQGTRVPNAHHPHH